MLPKSTTFTNNLVNGTTKAKTPGTISNPKPAPAPTPTTFEQNQAFAADFNARGGLAQYPTMDYMEPVAVNNTPVAPPQPAPVYRDAYGNVRGNQADVDRINNAGRGISTSVGNLQSSNDRSWANTQSGYTNQANQAYNTINDKQSGINNNRTNNALNLRRSMASIANGVRQGLRSGGVNLASMNALDSGAAEAMARAFARTGGAQVGDARNSAAAQNRLIQADQDLLGRERGEAMSNLSNWGRNQVADAQNTWGQNLNVLRSQGDADGIGHLVDTAQDDRWAGDATNWLLQQDAALAGRLNGIQAWGEDQVNSTAAQWDLAGRDGGNPFAVQEYNQGFQASGDGGYGGAPITQVPLYRRNNDGSAPVQIAAPAAPLYTRDDYQPLV